MLITIPAAAAGPAPIHSVLDLEPFLAYANCCRPDAVTIPAPVGPDDLPNGAALLAIKNCLEAEGIRLVPEPWRVPLDAPVHNPAWRAGSRFEGRSLIAVLGEADVEPLVIEWAPPVRDVAGLDALVTYLVPMVEEAERAGVRLAVRACLKPEWQGRLLRELESDWLGVCCTLRRGPHAPEPVQQIKAAGSRLSAIGISPDALHSRPIGATDLSAGAATWEPEPEARPLVAVAGHTATLPSIGPPATLRMRRTPAAPAPPLSWGAVLRKLKEMEFTGPLLVPSLENAVQYACVVGFFRGVLTGLQG